MLTIIVSQCVQCVGFPCADGNHGAYRVPDLDVDPAAVTIVLISEAAPTDPADYHYANGHLQVGALLPRSSSLPRPDTAELPRISGIRHSRLVPSAQLVGLVER